MPVLSAPKGWDLAIPGEREPVEDLRRRVAVILVRVWDWFSWIACDSLGTVAGL
ncbi:MAG: hypothetical protein ABIK79_11495 [Chloroflexota bacterium]|nr:hypothetical protein [Anaerolineae bacterium]